MIDRIEDGDYIFEVTVNFIFIERKKKREKDGAIIEEDEYGDNTIQIPINITGEVGFNTLVSLKLCVKDCLLARYENLNHSKTL